MLGSCIGTGECGRAPRGTRRSPAVAGRRAPVLGCRPARRRRGWRRAACDRRRTPSRAGSRAARTRPSRPIAAAPPTARRSSGSRSTLSSTSAIRSPPKHASASRCPSGDTATSSVRPITLSRAATASSMSTGSCRARDTCPSLSRTYAGGQILCHRCPPASRPRPYNGGPGPAEHLVSDTNCSAGATGSRLLTLNSWCQTPRVRVAVGHHYLVTQSGG